MANMDPAELKEKAVSLWKEIKSGIETLCFVVIAVGVLSVVIDSWILLSNGKQREALGLVVCVVLGAVGALIYVEQWLALGQGLLFGFGLVLGRVERKQCAQAAAIHLALAGLWYSLLTYGGPAVQGWLTLWPLTLGFPAPGLETQLMWGTFYLLLIYQALKIPERARIAYLSATVARAAAPGSLPPIGGSRF
jgi:hypothetical protein